MSTFYDLTFWSRNKSHIDKTDAYSLDSVITDIDGSRPISQDDIRPCVVEKTG